MLIAANIARYHRKSEPEEKHDEFARLDKKEKDAVRKLASILRISDGLDKEHEQLVSQVIVEKKNSSLILNVHYDGNIKMGRLAINKKSAMFRNVFGMKVKIKNI